MTYGTMSPTDKTHVCRFVIRIIVPLTGTHVAGYLCFVPSPLGKCQTL
ncbi:putative membrane protein (plasmid) [Rhizobium favelukesii]|uniref:Membrane protein n=1 Tax=Rhizobium favelukesii TaxID=348824 RepID=W6RN11_9HYPH|nr:putative membrane protein [Rhizobium favelukesii]